MNLQELGVLVRGILIAVLGNSQLTQQISNAIGLPAQEDQVALVLADTTAIKGDLLDSVVGLDNIHTELQDINTNLMAGIATIEADIAAFTSGGAVILPTIPPTGYGAPDVTGVFNAVWNTGQSIGGQTAWPWLQAAGRRALFELNYASVVVADDHFAYYFTSTDDFGVSGSFFPVWDSSLILSTDTLLGYLTRLNPGVISIFAASIGDAVRIRGNTGDGVTEFITLDNEATFDAIKLALFGSSALMSESLWPGLANVTLGTPVALAPGVTITEPMNGVIVELTSLPAKLSWYSFDGTLSYRNAGQLAFQSDNGNFDLAQSLGFTTALYVPRSMYLAAGVKLRTVGGVVGTVTPWVIV